MARRVGRCQEGSDYPMAARRGPLLPRTEASRVALRTGKGRIWEARPAGDRAADKDGARCPALDTAPWSGWRSAVQLCSAGRAISACPHGIANRQRAPALTPVYPQRGLHTGNTTLQSP